jgi:hypothetical protein
LKKIPNSEKILGLKKLSGKFSTKWGYQKKFPEKSQLSCPTSLKMRAKLKPTKLVGFGQA